MEITVRLSVYNPHHPDDEQARAANLVELTRIINAPAVPARATYIQFAEVASEAAVDSGLWGPDSGTLGVNPWLAVADVYFVVDRASVVHEISVEVTDNHPTTAEVHAAALEWVTRYGFSHAPSKEQAVSRGRPV